MGEVVFDTPVLPYMGEVVFDTPVLPYMGEGSPYHILLPLYKGGQYSLHHSYYTISKFINYFAIFSPKLNEGHSYWRPFY